MELIQLLTICAVTLVAALFLWEARRLRSQGGLLRKVLSFICFVLGTLIIGLVIAVGGLLILLS